MFNTPPPNMVKTRSARRKELAIMEGPSTSREEIAQHVPNAQENPLVDEEQKMADYISVTAGSSAKEEQIFQPHPERPPSPARSKISLASSVAARKKRLVLEAEKQKALIRMQLIDQQLEADLAGIDDEVYSPHGSDNGAQGSRRTIEKWMESSRRDQDNQQAAPEHVLFTGEPQPPPELAAGTSDGSGGVIQSLAMALKNLTATSVHNNYNASVLSRICTPKDLPEFSGDPLDWLQFKQAYKESTDVCKFSPKENLWRLRKCLRGPAKEAVSALLISASSPERIISTLELRFGDPDFILSRLVQDIKKLHPISHDYQKDIVQFSVKVQNFVEAVRAVGREEYVQGMSIVSLLLSKLPTVLLSKWSDYSYPLIKARLKSRLDILSDFLNTEAVKTSTTANIYTLSYRADQQTSKYKQHESTARPQPVLLQTERGSDKCQFCRGSQDHKLPECKQFKKALRKVRWQHVKRNGICYKCLESRHERETCPAPVCDKDNCGQAHHRLLHYVINHNNNDRRTERPVEPAESTADASTLETVAHVNATGSTVLLKVVPIRIHKPDGSVINSTALLDDGSTVTMISDELAARAGLRGRRESLRVCGPWSDNVFACDSTVLNFNLSGIDNKVHSIVARSVKQLDLPAQNLSIVDCDKYKHLRNIKSKLCNTDLKPEMLIGQDNYDLMLPLQVIVGKQFEPSATLTPLGWCVHGAVGAGRARRGRNGRAPPAVLLVGAAPPVDAARELQDLHDEVRRSFTIDAMGVTGKPRQNSDDIRALAQLERTATLIDGRWHVGLPWKDESCKMPDSFPNALSRLKGVERKMMANAAYARRYEERVHHLFDNDFARQLDDISPTSKTWYLPHFGVDNPNKNKLRLVFDAAARSNGLSLNDYLLTGPDLLSSLFGIMVRFRENIIAVTGDIKDMFLRVKIRLEDQNALRFLWRAAPTEPVKHYAMTSLIFGANCSPFIAQFIKNKNAQLFETTQPSAVAAIYQQHYMDDYIDSLPDEPTAINMVKEIINIHKKGGFEIRNWTSNSVSVLNSVPKESLGSAAVKFKIGQQYEGERTLGLIWYPGEDELGFDLSLKRIPPLIVQGEQKPTKRLMLKVIMSIFDVFGFLAPFTIQGKVLLQDTWRANIGWDDVIPDDIFSRWRGWLCLLNEINRIRVSRCYHHASMRASETDREPAAAAAEGATAATRPATSGATRAPSSYAGLSATSVNTGITNHNNCYKYNDLQLHLFSDASIKAMCSVAYWRWYDSTGNVCVAFVASKCRVAPVKPTTVPRLELQAALLAARLADTLLKEHKLIAVAKYFWCDSTTVLHWIKNDARSYKTFVANRLGEIDELTRAAEWRYVPTKLNVADIATRETYDSTSFNNVWFKGPNFLYENEAEWPRDLVNSAMNKSNVERVTFIQTMTSHLPIPDPTRFSSWLRLLRATTAVLKFINKLKLTNETDCTIMGRAEHLLLKQAQAESFGEEIAAIQGRKRLENNSRILSLSPILDEHGILRCAGRIDAARDIPSEMKRPAILDGKHQVARLLVKHYHEQAAHGNQETVVNNLKQKYWLVKIRPTVKYVASRCMICRHRKAKPEVPRMGDLPEARVAHHQRPFTFCGLDLFGPMEVTVGRRRELRYGVLFTCLTVRAVHLELVQSLTTDSLIMALRRMAARRGWPLELYSDNGTNLRGADAELRRAALELDDETLKIETAKKGVQWKFIPPSSPHWAGAWERLIRSVKTSLKVILKERAPKDETLNTLMLEVENIVNSRPLTHVSVEPGSVEALTPNHFLLGSSSNLPAAGSFNDTDFYLRKQWRKSQRLADMFWRRWVKEYLPELLPRKKWKQDHRPLQVGDLVLIVDPGAQRNVWPKAIIQQVFPGRDGRVRMVEVKTKTGTLKRSAARIARIPVSSEC